MEQPSSAVGRKLRAGAAKQGRRHWQQHLLRAAFIAACIGPALLAAAGPASAHPHVWVTMQSELVYGPDGSVTGIKQAWSFDDMYSTYATQGLEAKQAGVFTREELAPLAQENITSLKEFEYFTFGRFDGRKVTFGDPVDYWAEYKNSTLTLHFTLPVKAPVKARAVELEIYDPTYFVDFGFVKTDPLVLKNAPPDCRLTLKKPTDDEADARIQSLGEAAFSDGSNYGQMFANKVWVKCP